MSKTIKKICYIGAAYLSDYKKIDLYTIAVLTKWAEFKRYDWAKIKEHMKKPAFVFDGRKLLNRKELEDLDFKYYTIGE